MNAPVARTRWDGASTAKPAARRKPRPLAFWLHSAFGLKLSLFLAFVCLTGTIATVAHEIEWLYKPEVRASSFGAGSEDWGAMWQAAEAAYPDAKFTGIGSYDRADTAYFVKKVSAVDPDAEGFDIYVDPGTGKVTGHEYGRSLQDFMRGLHYYLFMPRDIGFYLVSALGFVLLVSLVTGLLVYKKFWRGLFSRPRTNRNLRTLMGDLHRLAGLWSTWFIAVIALTSVFYFFERIGLDWERPPPQATAMSDASDVSSSQIAEWAETARARKPGFQITAIFLPYEEGGPVTVQGHWKASLVRERADAVFLDPMTGEVIAERTAHRMGLKERIVQTADPLHFGTFGGLWTRLLWAAFGLAMTFLCASGAIIYAKRTRMALRDGIDLPVLDYLGSWKWPSVALVTVVPAIAFLFW